MDNLFKLAEEFRNAIDIAKDKGEFKTIHPFSKFPDDCCDIACDLLGQYLYEYNIKTKQINGTCLTDENWRHVWLITEDDLLIDITIDQFKGKIKTIFKTPKVYVGKDNEIFNIFSKNKFMEENTNFVDDSRFEGFGGMPSPRQKKLMQLYKIIINYIR